MKIVRDIKVNDILINKESITKILYSIILLLILCPSNNKKVINSCFLAIYFVSGTDTKHQKSSSILFQKQT